MHNINNQMIRFLYNNNTFCPYARPASVIVILVKKKIQLFLYFLIARNSSQNQQVWTSLQLIMRNTVV